MILDRALVEENRAGSGIGEGHKKRPEPCPGRWMIDDVIPLEV
jgi:hypothetical protein